MWTNGTQIAAYGYDQYGRRSTISRNGGSGAGTTYSYDGADRISGLVQSLTGGAAVTFTLGYDPASGLVSRAASNSAYTWHPGSSSTAYTTNGLNQYTQVGAASLTYSSNQQTKSLSTSGPNLTYDLENRLLSAGGPTLVTLAYDATGRLQTKTSGGATTTFLFAGSMLAGEYNSSGTILDRYIPGPNPDEAALWYSGTGTTTPQWLHADVQGSTIAWSNGTGGSLGSQAYDPHGQPSALERLPIFLHRPADDPRGPVLSLQGQGLLSGARALLSDRPRRLRKRRQLVRVRPRESAKRQRSKRVGRHQRGGCAFAWCPRRVYQQLWWRRGRHHSG